MPWLESCDLVTKTRPEFTEILFPNGVPTKSEEIRLAVDLYKTMVASSEGLVSRRQGVNTFFLTINGAIVGAVGFMLTISSPEALKLLGLSALTVTGFVLALAWRSLIISFGQLNTGKFKVINEIEKKLPVAIYAAEWTALGEGKDPKVYRSFTSREVWVPWTFMIVYSLATLVQVLSLVGLVNVPDFVATTFGI